MNSILFETKVSEQRILLVLSSILVLWTAKVSSIPADLDILQMFRLKPQPWQAAKTPTGSHFSNIQHVPYSADDVVDPINVDEANIIDNSRNVHGGNTRFNYIPTPNKRLIHINDLAKLTLTQRTEKERSLEKIIEKKNPIMEDKVKVEVLEKRLLKLGIWVYCNWEEKLPPPLHDGTQCTEAELNFILEQLEDVGPVKTHVA